MAEEILTPQKEGACLFILGCVHSLFVSLILSWDELSRLRGCGSFLQAGGDVPCCSFKICSAGWEDASVRRAKLWGRYPGGSPCPEETIKRNGHYSRSSPAEEACESQELRTDPLRMVTFVLRWHM